MMFRTCSQPLIDAIINHPDIRPTLEQGDHRLSSEDVLANDENIVFAGEQGAIVFIHEGAGVYRGHIAFLRDGRGKAALQAGRECLDKLFAAFDASKVVAAVPLQLRAARLLCRMLGFRSTGADDKQEFFVY